MNTAFWDSFTADSSANQSRWARLGTVIAPSGEGWKRSATANPAFMAFGDQVLLYYRGTGLAEGDSEERDQIGAAEVVQMGTRGIVLDPCSDGPVIPSGGPTAFDADVLDPSPIAFKDEVLLYYSALGPGEDSVGLASSPNGIEFTRVGSVLPGRAPAVVLRNGKIHMLVQVLDGKGYALKLLSSGDGRRFQPVQDEPVFGPAPGSWDGLSVVTARLFEDGEWTYMVYGGSDTTVDQPMHFGLARSKDLVDWERHPGNPIFSGGSSGSADDSAIWFPALAEAESVFVMLYEGGRATGESLDCSICMACLSK